MAGSRLEKFGTIYKRVQGLLRSGAMKPADRPIWMDVYEAFPPRDPPVYERPPPNHVVSQILYPEDIIRAQFYKVYGNPDVVDLSNEKVKTTCQKFVDKYLELLPSMQDKDQLFEATVTALKDQGLRLRTLEEVQQSVAQNTEKQAQKKESSQRLSVASIFGADTLNQAQKHDPDPSVEEEDDKFDPRL